MSDTRRCIKCEVTKPIEAFSLRNAGHGAMTRAKTCQLCLATSAETKRQAKAAAKLAPLRAAPCTCPPPVQVSPNLYGEPICIHCGHEPPPESVS